LRPGEALLLRPTAINAPPTCRPKPGCSRKVDVQLVPALKRSYNLRLKATGTVDGRLRRDTDTLRYRR
jgi:hypothetical protein